MEEIPRTELRIEVVDYSNPPSPIQVHRANEWGDEVSIAAYVAAKKDLPFEAVNEEGELETELTAAQARHPSFWSGETTKVTERRPVLAPEGLPSHIEVVPWIDPLVEAHGFAPRSMYVEACWLPVLGPTATWLYRRLGSWVASNEDGTVVDLTDLAVSLGLGEGLARTSMLTRAMGRLAMFGVIDWQGDRLAVRRALAPLTERRARSLSLTAYQLHQQLVGERDEVQNRLRNAETLS